MAWEDTWRGTDNCDWTLWVSGAQDSSWGSQAFLGLLTDQVKTELPGEVGWQESLRKERGEERGDKGSDGKTKAAFPRGQ